MDEQQQVQLTVEEPNGETFMEIKVVESSGCFLKAELELIPRFVEECYQSALKHVNKEVSFPGFRKGKAPAKVIEQQFSKELLQEWRNEVLERSVHLAIESRALPAAYKQGTIQATKISQMVRGSGVTINIEYEARPQVPEIKVDELPKLSVQSAPLDEKLVNRQIERIRLTSLEKKKVEERPIQQGDLVSLTVEEVEETAVLSNPALSGSLFLELVPGKVASWIRSALIGLRQGESCEVRNEQEEGFDLAFQLFGVEMPFRPVLLRLTVDDLWELAPFSPEKRWPQNGQERPTEERLQETRNAMERQAVQQAKEQHRQQVRQLLLDRYPFEVPFSLYKEELQQQLKGQQAALRSEEKTEEKMAVLAEELRKQLQLPYRFTFLLLALAHQQKIDVTAEEVGYMANYWSFSEQLRTGKEPELTAEVIQFCKRQALLNKVFEWVASQLEA